MEWNGTEISVWNMEDTRMELNGRFQEWNGRQSSILSYQFRTRFPALYLQKDIHGCRVIWLCNLVNRGNLVVYNAQTMCIIIASEEVHCNLQH